MYRTGIPTGSGMCCRMCASTMKVPVSEDASIENSLHCLAVALYMMVSPEQITERMARLEQIAMRLEVKEGKNGCVLINDSYNSDLASLDIALDFMSRRSDDKGKKRTLILSDMLETGQSSKLLYRQVAELVHSRGVEKIIGVGEEIRTAAARFEIEKYFFRTPKKSEYWGYLSPYIEPERLTIGSLMRNAGYTTACVGKWHLGLDWQLKDDSKPQILTPKKFGYTNTDFSAPVKRGPTELGFDYSFILPASLDMPPYAFVRNDRVVDPDVILTADAYPKKQDETVYAWDRKHTNENDIYWERGVWWRNGEMSRSFKFEECFPTIVDEGIAFIDREGRKDKPFFLYMPLTGPHTPWLPTVQFKGSTELGTYGDFMGDIDNVVARVNAKLKELGLEKNTIVIFASDNGGAWEEEDIQQYGHQSNWSRRGQKGDAWDGGHHVPLIVHWPDHIKRPGVCSQTVGLVDILATLADLTGQSLPKGQAEDSFSFKKVLDGDMNASTRDQIMYLSGSGKLAIKKGDWKYIDCLGSGGFTAPARLSPVKNGPKGQLYNMRTDSLESNNLFLREKGIANELSALLKKLLDQGYSRPQ